MIKLHGTLIERLETAVSLVCVDVTNEQIEHFYDIYKQAGVKLHSAAVEFF